MYSKIFKTIAVDGDTLIRDNETLKKFVTKGGTKQPFKPTNWDITTKDTNIMLADTGASKIIAVDFDGPEGDAYFNKALTLDPDCPYIAKGIGKGGGHLIYKIGNT